MAHMTAHHPKPPCCLRDFLILNIGPNKLRNLYITGPSNVVPFWVCYGLLIKISSYGAQKVR